MQSWNSWEGAAANYAAQQQALGFPNATVMGTIPSAVNPGVFNAAFNAPRQNPMHQQHWGMLTQQQQWEQQQQWQQWQQQFQQWQSQYGDKYQEAMKAQGQRTAWGARPTPPPPLPEEKPAPPPPPDDIERPPPPPADWPQDQPFVRNSNNQNNRGGRGGQNRGGLNRGGVNSRNNDTFQQNQNKFNSFQNKNFQSPGGFQSGEKRGQDGDSFGADGKRSRQDEFRGGRGFDSQGNMSGENRGRGGRGGRGARGGRGTRGRGSGNNFQAFNSGYQNNEFDDYSQGSGSQWNQDEFRNKSLQQGNDSLQQGVGDFDRFQQGDFGGQSFQRGSGGSDSFRDRPGQKNFGGTDKFDKAGPKEGPVAKSTTPSSTSGSADGELSEAEKTFDAQFKMWEQQFNTWKDQNKNHPDTDQYREYEAKWESWREQLLSRRETMRKKREVTSNVPKKSMPSLLTQVASQPSFASTEERLGHNKPGGKQNEPLSWQQDADNKQGSRWEQGKNQQPWQKDQDRDKNQGGPKWQQDKNQNTPWQQQEHDNNQAGQNWQQDKGRQSRWQQNDDKNKNQGGLNWQQDKNQERKPWQQNDDKNKNQGEPNLQQDKNQEKTPWQQEQEKNRSQLASRWQQSDPQQDKQSPWQDNKQTKPGSGPQLAVRNFGTDNKWDKSETPQIKSIAETLKTLFPQNLPPARTADDPMLITLGEDDEHLGTQKSSGGIPGLDLVTSDSAQKLPENAPPPPNALTATLQTITTPETDKPFVDPKLKSSESSQNKETQQMEPTQQVEPEKGDGEWHKDSFLDEEKQEGAADDYGDQQEKDQWSTEQPWQGEDYGMDRDFTQNYEPSFEEDRRAGMAPGNDQSGGFRGHTKDFGPRRPGMGQEFGTQRRDSFGPGIGDNFGPQHLEMADDFGQTPRPGMSDDFGPQHQGMRDNFGPSRPGMGDNFGPQRPGMGNNFGRSRPGMGDNFGPSRPGLGDNFGPQRQGMGDNLGPQRQGMGDNFGPQHQGMGDNFGPSRPGMADNFGPSYPGMGEDFNNQGFGGKFGMDSEFSGRHGGYGPIGGERTNTQYRGRGGGNFPPREYKSGYGNNPLYQDNMYDNREAFLAGRGEFRGPRDFIPGEDEFYPGVDPHLYPNEEDFLPGRGFAGRGESIAGRGFGRGQGRGFGRGRGRGFRTEEDEFPADIVPGRGTPPDGRAFADREVGLDKSRPGWDSQVPPEREPWAAEAPDRPGRLDKDAINKDDLPAELPSVDDKAVSPAAPASAPSPRLGPPVERGRLTYMPPRASARGGWGGGRDFYGQMRPPPMMAWEEEEEFKPATVVDYGHQPAKVLPTVAAKPREETFQEPLQTFDYGHGKPATSGTIRSEEREPETVGWRRNRSRPSWSADSDDRRRGGWERDDTRRNWQDGRGHGRGSRPWQDNDRAGDRDGDRDVGRGGRDRASERIKEELPKRMLTPPPAPPPPSMEPSPECTQIEDLLCLPGRVARPARLAIFMRGLPGCGKSFVTKLIKDKEIEHGANAPRILCLDDYFMAETEKEFVDPETKRKYTKKVMAYEYEPEMESQYRTSLGRGFRKTVDDGYFPFIIVDCVNNKLSHFEELWSYSKHKGFQNYIAEMDVDAATCAKRNTHGRTLQEIEELQKKWERTPYTYPRVDLCGLLQSASINEVEMEDLSEEEDFPTEESGVEPTSEETNKKASSAVPTSKWEQMEQTGEKLDRLDGLRRKPREAQTMEDWLQLPDDYNSRPAEPGKKRVSWADLEERKQQERMRAIGFVVGQTDWSRMTDPTFGGGALTQTKYI